MLPLLFRNRWFALGWAGLTLASVSAFVGKDGGADMISRSTRQIEEQRRLLASPTTPVAIVEQESRLPADALPQLRPLPGSFADPANPKVGDVFIDSLTGHRLRAVRRPGHQPEADQQVYSSTAALP